MTAKVAQARPIPRPGCRSSGCVKILLCRRKRADRSGRLPHCEIVASMRSLSSIESLRAGSAVVGLLNRYADTSDSVYVTRQRTVNPDVLLHQAVRPAVPREDNYRAHRHPIATRCQQFSIKMLIVGLCTCRPAGGVAARSASSTRSTYPFPCSRRSTAEPFEPLRLTLDPCQKSRGRRQR
jgi:hypothetical protein